MKGDAAIHPHRHCEERSDAAVHKLDCRATLRFARNDGGWTAALRSRVTVVIPFCIVLDPPWTPLDPPLDPRFHGGDNIFTGMTKRPGGDK